MSCFFFVAISPQLQAFNDRQDDRVDDHTEPQPPLPLPPLDDCKDYTFLTANAGHPEDFPNPLLGVWNPKRRGRNWRKGLEHVYHAFKEARVDRDGRPTGYYPIYFWEASDWHRLDFEVGVRPVPVVNTCNGMIIGHTCEQVGVFQYSQGVRFDLYREYVSFARVCRELDMLDPKMKHMILKEIRSGNFYGATVRKFQEPTSFWNKYDPWADHDLSFEKWRYFYENHPGEAPGLPPPLPPLREGPPPPRTLPPEQLPPPPPAVLNPSADANEKAMLDALNADRKKAEDAARAQSKGPAAGEAPYGIPVPGKPGFITSPFSQYKGYIDARGFAPGTEIRDPYDDPAQRIIRVPETTVPR